MLSSSQRKPIQHLQSCMTTVWSIPLRTAIPIVSGRLSLYPTPTAFCRAAAQESSRYHSNISTDLSRLSALYERIRGQTHMSLPNNPTVHSSSSFKIPLRPTPTFALPPKPTFTVDLPPKQSTRANYRSTSPRRETDSYRPSSRRDTDSYETQSRTDSYIPDRSSSRSPPRRTTDSYRPQSHRDRSRTRVDSYKPTSRRRGYSSSVSRSPEPRGRRHSSESTRNRSRSRSRTSRSRSISESRKNQSTEIRERPAATRQKSSDKSFENRTNTGPAR
jgi:hypothetical protein